MQADLALALTIQIQDVLRADLRILIMSATLETESLAKVLGEIPVVISEGKQYPVEVFYDDRPSATPVAQKVAQAIQRAFFDVVNGEGPDTHGWLTYVYPNEPVSASHSASGAATRR